MFVKHLAIVSGAWLTSFSRCFGQLYIVEPPDAVLALNKDVIEGSTSMFGGPYYGQIVEGELLVFQSDGCTADSIDLPTEKKNAKHKPSYVVMVRRGGCNFAQKVKNAQLKGAKGVLFADFTGGGTTQKEIARITISDDGTGGSLHIPSVLLSEEDSKFLIAAGDDTLGNPEKEPAARVNGRGPKSVIIKMSWSLPKDHAVQVDYWFTPASRDAMRFLTELAPYAINLKHFMDFQPHFWVMSMMRNFHDMCTDDTGDFCSFDPDQGGKVTGKMILEESVRQICLWETTRMLVPAHATGGFFSREWWRYIQEVSIKCPFNGPDEERSFGKECSLKAMRESGATTRRIRRCIDERSTTILAHELVNRAAMPTPLIINRTPYQGPLNAEFVAKAVCTAHTAEAMCLKAMNGTSEWRTITVVGIVLATSLAICVMLILLSWMLYSCKVCCPGEDIEIPTVNPGSIMRTGSAVEVVGRPAESAPVKNTSPTSTVDMQLRR